MLINSLSIAAVNIHEAGSICKCAQHNVWLAENNIYCLKRLQIHKMAIEGKRESLITNKKTIASRKQRTNHWSNESEIT